MAYTVNRVYRCKERTGGDRMWWVGVAGLVVVEWRGVIECGLVLVEFFGGIGGNRNGGWL